jgi:hypothetical protein
MDRIAEGLLRPLFTAFLPDRALGITAYSKGRNGQLAASAVEKPLERRRLAAMLKARR